MYIGILVRDFILILHTTSELKTSFQSNIDRILQLLWPNFCTISSFEEVTCVSGYHSEHSSFNKTFSECFRRFAKFKVIVCFKILHHKGNYSKLVTDMTLWTVCHPKCDKNVDIAWSSMYCWFHSVDVWISLFTFLMTT